MSNFKITFEYPWLLLLLIPAIALTLFPYFRMARKYRRTRNRIISVILHFVVMVLCVITLAGIGFSYDLVNAENEVLILVDASYSNESAQQSKDDFVKSLIDNSGTQYKVGVVTFGYTQVYAAKITDRAVDNKVYEQYLNATKPDDSATDIASALLYAKELFSNPKASKIILISDGLQTDNAAQETISSLVADGISVDTVYFSETVESSEVQINNVSTPDYNVGTGDTFQLEITVQSTYTGEAELRVYDSNKQEEERPAATIELSGGIQTITIDHSFILPGLHELRFELTSPADSIEFNNIYYTYMYLENFDNILVIESIDGESASLKEVLENQYIAYTVTTVNIFSDDLPITLDELRLFDEIILVNIANSDMPAGFIEILNSYVYDIGGGLFTFGGAEAADSKQAHAYNREDMFGTQFQRMLPVQVIDFTPPIAVMMILDISGSMSDKLPLAKEGAVSCVDSMSSRDFCGVMTLDSTYDEKVEITATTTAGKRRIHSAIYGLESNGGTQYTPSITRAGQALQAVNNVEKKHIMLVTDAQPGDSFEQYNAAITNCYANGITVSIVAIEADKSKIADMEAAVKNGGGAFYDVGVDSIISAMRDDLSNTSVDEVSEKSFTPVISSFTSAVNGITQESLTSAPQLLGFYGTVAKEGATTVLSGEYVPVYSQWNYGAGKVGSFMTSIAWSQEFFQSGTGQVLLRNVTSGLLPLSSIRSSDFIVTISEDNYGTVVGIETDLAEGESLSVTVSFPNVADEVKTDKAIPLATIDRYSKASFSSATSGIYEILVEKKDSAGNVISYSTYYRSFSYSKEYNYFADSEEGLDLLTSLAKRGKGAVITSAEEATEGMVKTLHETYDPYLPIIITAIVLFLLDVAVRKFKFKWLHEIVRDSKAKKKLRQI